LCASYNRQVFRVREKDPSQFAIAAILASGGSAPAIASSGVLVV
jgi:hypothetical protein